MTPFRENLRGILTLIACNFLFLINDTLIKIVSARLPLGETIFIRGMLVTALLTPLVYFTGQPGQLALLRNRPVAWRMVAEIAAAFCYLVALIHIPIANANTISQIVPLAVTAAGALFFGEAVGWRRWTAITVGFAGVVIVVRPGLEGFNGFSVLALASALFVTLRDVTTRLMPKALSALTVALLTGTLVGLCGPLYGLAMGEVWTLPLPADFGRLCVGVFFLIGGYLTAVEFMRHGDISVVAPFRYVVIVFAIIVGFLVWGEVPDWPVFAGMAVIAASGIYTFRRERNLARLREEAAAGEGL